jgi:outer membrane immunogenic protein
MRKYLIPAAIAAVLVGAPAAAEDSPFEGFYAGVNGGVAWSDSSAKAVLSTTSTTPVVTPPIAGGTVTAINIGNADLGGHHGTGFTGGIEAGYNHVSNHNGLLLGFESDLDVYNINGDRTNVVSAGGTTYTSNQRLDTDWMWSLRPRVGYASGAFLGYVTGGIAFTTVRYTASVDDSSTAANSVLVDHKKSKTGYVVGGGLAYALGSNISLKGEYLFQNYGKESATATSTNGFYTLSGQEYLKSHLFRAGLDYNF